MNLTKLYFDNMDIFSEFPRVRSSDPVTSFEAAEGVKQFEKQHNYIIVACLQTYGALGKDGISRHCALDRQQVSKRLHELQRAGIIRLTGKTVKSDANKNEREWTLA